MAGLPWTGGMVVSKTPKLFFVMGFALRSQLSIEREGLDTIQSAQLGWIRTEVADQGCLVGVRSPFSIDDAVILLDVEPVCIGTLAEKLEISPS